MRKTETLNLRVSAEFKRRLVQEARREKRSVTNYLEATLEGLWKAKMSSPRPSKETEEQGGA
jgi:predicted HicB family RNase H-like nuclease